MMRHSAKTTPDGQPAPLRAEHEPACEPLGRDARRGLVCFLLILPAALLAESLKLVEVAAGGRTFYEQRLPLDDGRAFLSADDDGDGVFDVFSVTLAGGPPILLNEPLSAPFTFAFPTNLSPDGSRLVYGVDGSAGLRLYSVPVAGPETASVRLDLDVAWDLDFNRTFISGDGQRLIFEGNQQSESVYELFSVPIAGPAGAMAKLNGLLLTGSVSQPVLSRDGQTVVYQADQDAGEANREFYSVAVDGSSPPVRLSDGGSLGTQPVVTPTRVVYYRNGALYSVPIDGPASASVEISITPEAGESIRTSLFQITPDGQTVVYFVNTPSGYQLYGVPIDGPSSAGIQLTPDGEDVVEFKLAGNSMVVFDCRRPTSGRELFSVPLTGPSTATVALNQDIVPMNGSTSTFQISPDGGRVVFQASLDVENQPELWSVPIAGPASAGLKLNPPLPPDSDVFFDFVISPDSQRVAYRVDLDATNVFDLYSVGISGPSGSGIKLNGPLAGGGDVCANRSDCYRFAPDSRRVVFEAEADADNEVELFIGDDGQAAAAFVSAAVQTVYEGSIVVLQIDIGAPSVFPVTMQIVQTGGSASQADYSLSATVVIPPGMTTADVPVTVVADQDRDAGETLELSLTNVQNASLGLPFTTVLTIRPEGEIFFDGFESGN